MNISLLSVGVGLCALAVGAAMPAGAVPSAHTPAVNACSVGPEGAPMVPVAAVADGRGGSLVWLTDAETNLWLCRADAEGHVYAYSLIFDDLLAGAGASLVKPIYIDDDGKPVPPVQDPLAVAELACQAYLAGNGGKVVGKVIGKGEDGLNAEWLPGYFVFLETVAGETFLCDATANAQVWAFAKIGDPIDLGSPVG